MENTKNLSSSVTYATVSTPEPLLETKRADTIVQETDYGTAANVGQLAGNKHPPYLASSYKQNVLDYLSRPTPIFSGVVSPGYYGVITKVPMETGTGQPFFPGYDPFGYQLNGAYGARFTLCFRVEFSNSPQDAGIFKMAVQPMSLTGSYFQPINFPTVYSTLPSVEINLADTNTGVLRYPFLYSADYYRFGHGEYYGTLGLCAYTPCEPGVGNTIGVHYTIYAWLEDVEVIGPGTPNILVTPQMGTGEEFKVAGPVSTLMKLGKTITDKVGLYVPKLASYTRPLGWVFSGIGSLASQFGFSMPNDGGTTTMMPVYGRCLNNVNGVEHAQEFGGYSNNEIAILPNFACKDYDEMSLQALTSIPTPIAQFPLNLTDSPGFFKWVCQVSPAAFYYQSGTAGFAQDCSAGPTTPGFLPSGVFSVAQFFHYWRGDFTFRFKFARSKFMGGKLLVGYNPLPDTPFANAPENPRYDFRSCVVDLRNESYCDLVVPYSYSTDMCSTGFQATGFSNGIDASINNGCVFMQVVDPLTSTGDTAAICWVEVEVFTNDGFVFGGLNTSITTLAPAGAPLVAQMGDDHAVALERTVGEAILSAKQLASRPTWVFSSFGKNTSLLSSAVFLPSYAINNGVSPAFSWQGGSSAFNQIASWYLFNRGSVVHKFVPVVGANGSTFSSISMSNAYSNTTGAPLSIESRCANIVRVPFYNCHNRAPNTHVNQTAQHTRLTTIDLNLQGSDQSGYYTVVPGDDFQFGGFMWFPPLVIIPPGVAFQTPPFTGA